MGNLIVSDLSLEMVVAVRPLVARIKRQDRSLADQLVRAASSVCLNTAEADYSDPGNKRARLFTAAGSANATRAALRVAVAWSYCAPREAEAALALLDRIVAILWRLTR
jgi:four helix bundle protein